MDKYIIDGVEYSYGEEVEVRDIRDGKWNTAIFVGYIEKAEDPVITVSKMRENDFKYGNNFSIITNRYIRKTNLNYQVEKQN